MWRGLVPFVQFVVDCWLGLGAFALVSVTACGLWSAFDGVRESSRDVV